MFLTTWTRVTNPTVLIVVVVFILGSIEFTLANKQCKSTVMKIVMKQCSNAGMRSRRNVRDGPPEIETNKDIGSPGDHHDLARRQETIIYDKSGPQGIHRSISMEVVSGRQRSVIGRRRRAAQIMERETLPKVLGDDLGFELSTDELDELYNEVVKRFERNSHKSPEEAKRLFLDIAARCCQNEEVCLREKIISCV